MQSKKLVLIFIFSILFNSLLSGCTLETFYSTGSSYELEEWNLCENEGFPSVYLKFKSKEKIYLRVYNSNGELIDWEYFYGGDNTTLSIGSYRETLSSTKVNLKAFDSNEKIIDDKTKEFTINGPDLEIKSCYYDIWKTQDKNSLIEIKTIIYNSGDIPVFPETLKIMYKNNSYEGHILPCNVLPDSYETMYSFIYIEEIEKDDDFNLKIFDKDSNIISEKNLKFDNTNYCRTARYTSGVDSPLSVPVPDHLYSYYETKEELIVDDYSAFVFDKYDDSYIELFLDLFISNLDFSGYFNHLTDPEKINKVASFVQYLDYIPDFEEGDEEREDPQYPLETLFRKNNCGGGDCEDKAILIASFLHNLGYNVSLLRIPDHMAVGVNLDEDDLPEYDYYIDKYYFLDTSPQDLGIVYSKYKNPSDLEVYTINTRPFIDHYWRNGSLTIYSESSGKKNLKVVIFIENLGNKKAENIKVKSLFYTNSNLEISKKSKTITEIPPYTKEKLIFELSIPGNFESWFDTRVYLNEDMVSKRTSEKEFTFD